MQTLGSKMNLAKCLEATDNAANLAEVTQLYREGFAGLVRHKGHAVALQETRECWPGALAFVEATEATVASSSEEQDSSEELE